MTLYMETTKIPAVKTITEINSYLFGLSFVRGLQMRKNDEGDIEGLAFSIEISGREVSFLLPAKRDPVYQILQRKRSVAYRQRSAEKDWEQAERVAWRQILRWIQAQVALIETDMVEPAEVFMPYAVVGPKQTLYQKFKEQADQFLLPGAS